MSGNLNFGPKNGQIVTHLATFYDGWKHLLWWVDARFMVGGNQFKNKFVNPFRKLY